MNEIAAYSVLVVDDSPQQIRYISEILKPEGGRIYAATSCDAAFKILENHRPDLILSDIVMPDIDGFEFCKIVKADPKTSDIPVIFATAYHDIEYIGKGFEVGGCDYVVKPFIKEELLERVKVRIRLAQKRVELQNAYAELDKFCYTVSHDIRSPLYVICQLSELLRRELGEENFDEVTKICGMLESKSKQAANMTEGLHRFSKAFYEQLNYTLVDMNCLFDNVYQELKMLENGRDILFVKSELPAVWADELLLRLVVQNVLSNALKFTRNRKIAKIKVSAESDKNQIVYIISDNGIGFEEQYSNELFQVFRKLHGQEEYEGDGIGLATVRRILFRHGGNAQIESKKDIGTSVMLSLPTDRHKL